jgi:gas vesicle protein
MSIADIGNLLLGLGVGGVAGAAAAFLVAGNKLSSSLQQFGAKLSAFLVAHQQDPEARELAELFNQLKLDVQKTVQSLLNLKRMLKWK